KIFFAIHAVYADLTLNLARMFVSGLTTFALRGVRDALSYGRVSEPMLDAFLFSRLHIERVFLTSLVMSSGITMRFKATQCIFNGLTFMNPNLRHSNPPMSDIRIQSRSRLLVL